jgi:hypothetical protein
MELGYKMGVIVYAILFQTIFIIMRIYLAHYIPLESAQVQMQNKRKNYITDQVDNDMDE